MYLYKQSSSCRGGQCIYVLAPVGIDLDEFDFSSDTRSVERDDFIHELVFGSTIVDNDCDEVISEVTRRYGRDPISYMGYVVLIDEC